MTASCQQTCDWLCTAGNWASVISTIAAIVAIVLAIIGWKKARLIAVESSSRAELHEAYLGIYRAIAELEARCHAHWSQHWSETDIDRASIGVAIMLAKLGALRSALSAIKRDDATLMQVPHIRNTFTQLRQHVALDAEKPHRIETEIRRQKIQSTSDLAWNLHKHVRETYSQRDH